MVYSDTTYDEGYPKEIVFTARNANEEEAFEAAKQFLGYLGRLYLTARETEHSAGSYFITISVDPDDDDMGLGLRSVPDAGAWERR